MNEKTINTAFAGVKVADFSWSVAGPLISKFLADNGATVVRVESPSRLCILRTSAPFKDKKPGQNRSGYFAWQNANKYSISLDLNKPEARGIAQQLIAWGDIVMEAFRPGTMEQWGLGYEEVKKINPKAIMLSSSSQGQTGPHAKFAALGIPLVGLAGFSQFLGWPDGGPLPFPMAYTDALSPRLAAAVLIAALIYKRRTGRGQYIDVSQVESSLQFLAPMILNYTSNGKEGQLLGNSHPSSAPHGIYKCNGQERWCAISVSTDQQWQAFCNVLQNPAWIKENRFATFLGRKENETELNRLIEQWTINHKPEEIMVKMQAAGVPAGVVKNARDLYEDPQLRARQLFWKTEHKELGKFTSLGQAFRLSKTPARLSRAAPLLGEHTEYVCTELLGISAEQFKKIRQSDAFG
jgi:benzylsuccinate CoA-transferase BbsF subunit